MVEIAGGDLTWRTSINGQHEEVIVPRLEIALAVRFVLQSRDDERRIRPLRTFRLFRWLDTSWGGSSGTNMEKAIHLPSGDQLKPRGDRSS